MSETPRTDAEAYDTGLLLLEDDPEPGIVVQAEFARTLERELTSVTRERDEARTKRLQTLANVADERDALHAEVERLTSAKDGAYEERNRCVALIARMALSLGCRAGLARTAIEGWSEDWHGCIYIDLPTGQVSWHYHDSHGHLFEGLPKYAAPWDGHDTPEKYRRADAAREFRSAEVEACAPYLKEGETPAERIQRDIADNAAVLSLLAKSRAEVERIRMIVDLYFMPWGAAKAAMWEGTVGDVGFTAENAMRALKAALTPAEVTK